MPRKAKTQAGKRGKIVVDVKYQQHLGSTISESGYTAIRVSPDDHNLDDGPILEKYAKGRYPIITGDKTMYKSNPAGKGATAFISVPDVKREQLPDLQTSLKGLLQQNTSKTLAGKCYELSVDGEPIIFDLEIQ